MLFEQAKATLVPFDVNQHAIENKQDFLVSRLEGHSNEALLTPTGGTAVPRPVARQSDFLITSSLRRVIESVFQMNEFVRKVPYKVGLLDGGE